MIDHQVLQLGIRDALADLEVAYTAPVYGDVEWGDLGAYSIITMSVASGKYTRATGSFLTDGFKVGMEITATGFVEADNNTTTTITAVTATTVSVTATLTDEDADTGRTLICGMPAGFATENVAFEPTQGVPFFEEAFPSGPTRQITLGEFGWIEHDPLYVLHIHVPEGIGVGAANAYADGVITLLAPRAAVTLSNGDVVRVRTNPGPFRTQLRNFRTGYATVTVTVPLRLHTTNAI